MRALAALALALGAAGCLGVPDPGAGRDAGDAADGAPGAADGGATGECPGTLAGFADGFATLDLWAPVDVTGCGFEPQLPGVAITNSTDPVVPCAMTAIEHFSPADGAAAVSFETSFSGIVEVALLGDDDSSYRLSYDGTVATFEYCDQPGSCSSNGQNASGLGELILTTNGAVVEATVGVIALTPEPITADCVRLALGLRQSDAGELAASNVTFVDVNVPD